MTVTLEKVGKKFLRQWIFREVSLSIQHGNCYGVSGPNGSGKSTLLQIVSGVLTPSEGVVGFNLNGQEIHVSDVFRHVTVSAPYLELVEEFTLNELLSFHFKLKNPVEDIGLSYIPEMLMLEEHQNKQVRHFSSGMKQRLQVGLAVLTQSQLLLLDEPTTNLDTEGIEWFNKLLAPHKTKRTVVIASNQEHDFVHCEKLINMADLKTM